jgi:hypothetical protein
MPALHEALVVATVVLVDVVTALDLTILSVRLSNSQVDSKVHSLVVCRPVPRKSYPCRMPDRI